MIHGDVSEDGVPAITIVVDGEGWSAIIDTGFNGDLELPVTASQLTIVSCQAASEPVGRCKDAGTASSRLPIRLWPGG